MLVNRNVFYLMSDTRIVIVDSGKRKQDSGALIVVTPPLKPAVKFCSTVAIANSN